MLYWRIVEYVPHFLLIIFEDGIVVDHLSIESGLACEQSKEVSAVHVGNILPYSNTYDHGRDANSWLDIESWLHRMNYYSLIALTY
jgi:hypothetical protein